MRDGFPGGFRHLLHPLAQVEAASSFYGYAEAFVLDEWKDLYTDPPPSLDDLVGLRPHDILDVLAVLGLRFELAGYAEEEGDFCNSFWSTSYSGSLVERILYGYAHRVIDDVEVDERIVMAALKSTDLIFVRDDLGLASEAYFMVLDSDGKAVAKREAASELRSTKLFRPDENPRARARGDGPRTSGRVLADRVALVVRAASTPLSPEEIAKRAKHDNIPSVTAALHQMVEYGRPKRLKGWVVRVAEGLYAWADAPNGAERSKAGRS
jgi:hypothetical protein